jgi:hypothetical protein
VIELGLDVAVKVVPVAPNTAAVYSTVAATSDVAVAVPIVGEFGIAAFELPTAKDLADNATPVFILLVAIIPNSHFQYPLLLWLLCL